MKKLKFRKTLADLILRGDKDVTWRLFDDKNLSVGDKLELIVWETNVVFGRAQIVEVHAKKLGDVVEQDYIGHEKYENKQAMLENYKNYYGDRVTFDTEVKIIKFELI